MKITINEVEKEYADGITFEDIAKEEFAAGVYETEPLIAVFNGALRELCRTPEKDGDLELLTYRDRDGYRAYRRSLVLLMQKALSIYLLDVKDEKVPVDVEVLYSLGSGYFCRMEDGREFTEDDLRHIEDTMRSLVEKNLPIRKYSLKTTEARTVFREEGMFDKDRLLRYRPSSNTNVYELDGLKDYFYGYMLPSTAYIKYFSLRKYEDGFVLMYPKRKAPTVVPEFQPSTKLFQVLKLANEWSETMEIPTVGALNDAISEGRTVDIIQMQEALMEARIADLAREIASNEERKFVLIAGPSSSGKTTFAHRLSTQLRAIGLHPHPLSLDNYYRDRSEMPLDEFGEKDFEAIEGLNLEQFNEDMKNLLQGERVEIPTFNFTAGKSEYHGNYMQLGEGDLLVVEGIHGLNDRMTASLPAESKFKIYISALTQLSIDEHNPLSTSDNRLIRRIVRDARTRGSDARETISMWASVRRGEEKNIFPFQEKADAMFNSALIYEMAVLKTYVVPQLYAIDPDAAEYAEAKRLLKFLDYFLAIPSEYIGPNSLVREFIGGSSYKV